MEISEKIKKQILDIIFKYIDKNSCDVFLFGSYASEKARQSSDIDIGIDCNKKLSLTELLTIKEDLNENVDILRKIDIVDFKSDLDEDFKKITLKDRKIWHMK